MFIVFDLDLLWGWTLVSGSIPILITSSLSLVPWIDLISVALQSGLIGFKSLRT